MYYIMLKTCLASALLSKQCQYKSGGRPPAFMSLFAVRRAGLDKLAARFVEEIIKVRAVDLPSFPQD